MALECNGLFAYIGRPISFIKMILNITDNGKILKENFNISISDFTLLTGENGSGKTQLLEFIRDYSGGFAVYDELGNPRFDENGQEIRFSLASDENKPLGEIIYSYPGLRNSSYSLDHLQDPLISTITQQWLQLEPFVWAYNSIKHKTFSNELMEMQELNNALSRLVSTSQANNQLIQIVTKTISDYQFKQLKNLSESCGKPIGDLNLIDFIIFYQIPTDLFSAALDLLFHQFFLKSKYYCSLTEGVNPPWEIFNEILERASFKYKAEYSISTNEELPLPVKLVDRQNGKEITFQSLSSGETTIMALIFALYNSSNKGHFPQVILFDEPDAHLHPSLTQVFLDVIQDVLINLHKVKVILTTHSPSTVALAPDESIYCMNRDLGRPIKQDKRTAINILSSGLASLTIEESSLGIAYNIREANKHVLFTEGITDKINIEIAWEKLYPGRSRNFYIQDCFSAKVLGNLFTQGDQAPDGIFHQFSDLKMIALFDFDGAGYSEWNNKKKFPVLLEENPRKCLTRFNRKNGYLLLLPVPNISEIIQQVIISDNDTYEDKSHLTIESLLFNTSELKKYFKTLALPGGGTANVFNDNRSKRDFSDSLNDLDASAFSEFTPLFEKIEVLLNS